MRNSIKKQDQTKEPTSAAKLDKQDISGRTNGDVKLSDAELDQASGGVQYSVALPANIAQAGGGTSNIRGGEDMVGCRR